MNMKIQLFFKQKVKSKKFAACQFAALIQINSTMHFLPATIFFCSWLAFFLLHALDEEITR
jgi:hypothetical protein